MPAANMTPLDVAAQIDRTLRRNIQWPLRTVASTPVTVSLLDRAIRSNATGGNRVVNLPDATTCPGMFFEIKKTDASVNTVTVKSAVGGQNIDGAASVILTSQYQWLVVMSNGTDYDIYSSASGSGSATLVGRGKDYQSFQSGDLAITAGGVPGVVAGTSYSLMLAVAGKVTFTLSGVFIGAGTTPSASLGLRIDDGVDYVCATITEHNFSGAFATMDTPMSGVVAVTLAAGTHTVDWIACSTNGSPHIRASAGTYATMDIDYPVAAFPGGPWEIIARQELIADTDTITFPSLDGDNDGIYFLVLEAIKGGAALTNYSLQPNGSNANCTSCDLLIPGASSSAYPADIILLHSGSPDGASFMVTALLPAKTGRLRFVKIDGNEFGGGASFRNAGGGTWNDSVSNITSLVLKADMANAFKTGTIATLYKLSQNP